MDDGDIVMMEDENVPPQECEEDWDEYVTAMERDGDLLAELGHMLNVNIFRIKDSVAALLRHSENHEVEDESLFDWSSICEELEVAVNGHECDSADVGRR
ncbi:hypothetical protein GCK32_000842, partial [Trichostrongylus colubriformis]